MYKIWFAKTQEHAIIPSKRKEDADYDLYACFDENEVAIQPHEIKLISTGIASAFDVKYKVAFKERGSNTKSRLILMSGEIDSGYRGEWFVALYNTQHIPIEISKSIEDYEYTKDYIRVPYSKAICQFAIEEVPDMDVEEITYSELKNIESKRGLGMLGSTNK